MRGIVELAANDSIGHVKLSLLEGVIAESDSVSVCEVEGEGERLGEEDKVEDSVTDIEVVAVAVCESETVEDAVRESERVGPEPLNVAVNENDVDAEIDRVRVSPCVTVSEPTGVKVSVMVDENRVVSVDVGITVADDVNELVATIVKVDVMTTDLVIVSAKDNV